MFEELDDPRPPAFGATQLSETVARSRRITRCQAVGRRLAFAAAAVVACAGLAVVAVDDSDDSQPVAVTATTAPPITTTATIATTAPVDTAPPITEPVTTEPEPTTTTIPPLGDSGCYQRPASPPAGSSYDQVPPSIEIRLTVETTTVAAGEELAWNMAVRNTTDEPVSYFAPPLSYAPFVWITDEHGAVLFDSAAGKGGVPEGNYETFGPGEERVATGTAPQALCGEGGSDVPRLVEYRPGRYFLRGEWYGRWSEPVPFEVS